MTATLSLAVGGFEMEERKYYKIRGMTCAACAARVEKAVRGVEGVTSCSVNLLTESLVVDGTSTSEKIVEAVTRAGYGVSDLPADDGMRQLRRRFIASLGLCMILAYFSMGHAMWDWPVPPWLQGNHVGIGLVQLLLSAAVMIINRRFFVNGVRGVIHRAPNMDTLVALGAFASFGYSTVVLIYLAAGSAPAEHDFYYESAAMILTLITLGKLLEAKSKGRTTDALKALAKLAPQTAVVVRDGREITLSPEEIILGDVFVVRPGERIPTDGTVSEGYSSVDESSLTGESIPVDKAEGSAVYSGTLNQSGYLRCVATKVGEDTTLARVIRLVSEATATKAPIAKIADRVSGVFVPVVMSISAVTCFVWLLLGRDIGFALTRAVSVLVISCPCALGLATPVAIMAGAGVGARSGILFKNAAALEELGKAQIVVMDKTGTLTRGLPEITDIIPVGSRYGDISEDELLSLAFSVERYSEHPLAKAINKAAQERGIEAVETADFRAFPGNGLEARRLGTGGIASGGIASKGIPGADGCDEMISGGNYRFISDRAEISDFVRESCDGLAAQGKTPILFALGSELIGIIAVADTIRDSSSRAVKELHGMGIRVVMLTGDIEITANAVGREIGVDEVIAGILPDGKNETIKRLSSEGRVVMVGDGINDSPALACADIGMAIGAGSDVAIDAAQVVLMRDDPADVPAAIKLSRATLRTIHGNLFWAFIYNICGIPLAAGVFIDQFGWQLNPMFAAAAMSLSSIFVVTNALRLNLVKLHGEYGESRHPQSEPGPRDKEEKIDAKKSIMINDEAKGRSDSNMAGNMTDNETDMIVRTIHISGMMCSHCEMHTRKAIEALDGVAKADVSYETGIAEVHLSGNVADEILMKAVEEQGYKVDSVE